MIRSSIIIMCSSGRIISLLSFLSKKSRKIYLLGKEVQREVNLWSVLPEKEIGNKIRMNNYF